MCLYKKMKRRDASHASLFYYAKTLWTIDHRPWTTQLKHHSHAHSIIA